MSSKGTAASAAVERKSLVARNFEQILSTFKEGVCITDSSGEVIHINESYSSITGISKYDILGRNVVDLVKNGIIDIVLNPEVVRTKNFISRVQRVASGKILMLEATPIFDADNNVVLCFTLVRDVTTISELKEQIMEQAELLEALKQIASANEGADYAGVKPIIASSAAMHKLNKSLADIAYTDVTVLLLGETGVGKEVTARRIHALSSRRDKIFVKIDCGSIPEQLIETELFGYMPGSFSGGNKSGKVGLLEAAEGGTLFLDEIGELPLQMQTRLLRFLQDREVLRVGATTPKKVDVRVITATNRNLEEAVAQGKFRSDLYYRIKVAAFAIPPLRERKSDIVPLALGFLDFFNYKFKKKVVLSEAIKESLLAHDWPGNVRELENVVQMLVVTGGEGLMASGSMSALARRGGGPEEKDALIDFDLRNKSYDEIMGEMEARVLTLALRQFGSITEIAKHFQVARSTIFRKMKRMEKAGRARPRGAARQQ